ncbi:Adenosine deaminase-like protein [Sergentomyia squamirostris]
MDFRRLPKIELHAHLNGSLSNANILELYFLKYPKKDEEINAKAYKVEKNLKKLTECFIKFKYAHELTDCPERLARATENVIRDFSADNVVYLELRTTPRATEYMTKEIYLKTVCETIRKCREIFPEIIVKLLPSIDRSYGVKNASETIDMIIEFRENFPDVIVGVDVSGNPIGTEFRKFRDCLQKARNAGLKIAVHCAETKGTVDENMEMLDFGMERMGHGTFMNESPETWNKLLEKKIFVECCISSNLKCGTVVDIDQHHIKKLLDADHPVGICTDDFGVFDTNLSREFEICSKTFNLSSTDIESIILTSIEHSFATDSEKSTLKTLVSDFFTETEQAENFT